jgi:hypothetical protein
MTPFVFDFWIGYDDDDDDKEDDDNDDDSLTALYRKIRPF